VTGKSASPKPFEMIAGHAALDFVNSLDDRFAESGPAELLVDYDDVLRFVSQAELISARQLRELKKLDASPKERSTALAEALQLREALAAVLYPLLDHAEPAKGALSDLETIFKHAAGHRKLAFEEIDNAGLPARFVWEYKDVAREVQSPVWLLAEAANDLLTSPQASHIRRCASSTCQWLFLDTSKNHTRRWCDMKVCGNRNKARRFHLRQAAG
jgi:predicted RNA-binding Zn ribbon-like protein